MYDCLLEVKAYANKNWRVRERLLLLLDADLRVEPRKPPVSIETLMPAIIGRLDDRAAAVRSAGYKCM
eukprot:SAG31_NODE_1179_length_9530_cov_8.153748_4_plen_68_part_00